MNTNRYYIALIHNPLYQSAYNEAFSIKRALEAYDNIVYIYTATKSLLNEIRSNPIHLAFNLARRTVNNPNNTSVSAICELAEIPLIGPSVFTSSICNCKEILFQILKYDKIPLDDGLKYSIFDVIEVFLLQNCNKLVVMQSLNHHHLESQLKTDIEALCIKTYQSIHGSNFCKFVFHVSENNEPLLIDVNPMPLLTEDSVFAKIMAQNGIDYNSFINLILLSSIRENNLQISDKYLILNSFSKITNTFLHNIIKSK